METNTIYSTSRQCCCFTGHRPEKLSRPAEEIKADLDKRIRAAVAEGFTVFITGMSRGVDIWAAETVLRLIEAGLPLRLICAVPFQGFGRNWTADWKERYARILAAASAVQYISAGYSPSCFEARNEWMVDHAQLVIAVYGGGRGGTRNTIEYAWRKKAPVYCIPG